MPQNLDHTGRSSNEPIAWPGLVLERLAHVVAGNPDKVAVRCGENVMSFVELTTRSDALAAQLAESGVGAGDLVAIGLQRSLDLVVSVFGVWKTGGAFVPLDPDYPQLRLLQVLEDAAPRAIITDRRSEERMQYPSAERVLVENVPDCRAGHDVAAAVAAKDLAYVIFTSGSTGRPKGVQVSHGALANFLSGIQQTLQMQPDDSLAAITSISFDISILEIVLPLMQGATVVVLDRQQSSDGKKLAAALEAQQCTYLQATPVTWQLLLDSGWEGKDDLVAICGGENFPRPLAEQLLPRSGRLFNAYGPTEATIWATIELVESGSGPVSIGRALPNYDAHILDEHLQPVADGDTGQLFLGGPSLATGYLNRPEETALRFICHASAGRLYATGDLARHSTSGKLEFVGRVDHQMKIRGFRVEPGDIEARLLELPGVKEALVVLREDTPGNKKLVAYLIADGTTELDSENLRRLLQSELPLFMIPHHFVQLAEFPKTPNRKLDRKQLPVPEQASDSVPTAALDPLETFLQSVWVDVLGVAAIRRDDDFFELGGDSIQAARITNRIEDWLGELLWPVIIFDAPTIAALADYLRSSFPDAVAAKTAINEPRSGSTDRVVDERLVAEFDSLIEPLADFPLPKVKNPPAIFLLCPPRSGSTLLRVMLAGHPGLFAPPEIELITFNTMRERAEVFSGRESYRLEGVIRAVVEIKHCTVDEARAIVAAEETSGTTVAEFYGKMQAWLDGRLLVDKTPANCLDLNALRRIEDYFDEPLYIHLTRHPFGMIRSFVKARLSEVFFRRVPHEFSTRELAELIWLGCHRNTLTALSSVPAQRQFRLSFESLTHGPADSMQQLCEFLGIEFRAEMLEPSRNKEAKMTDGLHAESKMMGDPKFHQHDHIDPRVADRWLEEMQGETLGPPVRTLAKLLGYGDLGPDRVEGEREDFVL